MIRPDTTINDIIVLIPARGGIVFVARAATGGGLRDVFLGSADADEVRLGGRAEAADWSGRGGCVGG
jgi:hypothetical protein